MKIGLIGKKCGMTRIFTADGIALPVTVIEILPNRITQVKTIEKDGYAAIQVTTGSCKRTRLSKPEAGHFAKAAVEPGAGLWEFRLDKLNRDRKEAEEFTVGMELGADRFAVGQYVDVTGTTKGKGFAGVIKRHHFSSQDASHGNSLSHRVPGSIGQRQTPGRVFKNKRMAGHLGDAKRTILSQPVVSIDVERHLLLVQGAVPGAAGSFIIVRPAIKAGEKSWN